MKKKTTPVKVKIKRSVETKVTTTEYIDMTREDVERIICERVGFNYDDKFVSHIRFVYNLDSTGDFSSLEIYKTTEKGSC